MMFSLIDLGRLCLAVVACGLVIVLPGRSLALLFDVGRCTTGPRREEGDPLDGIVIGLAILPIIDSLITRFFGLDTALAVTLALAASVLVRRGNNRPAWHLPPRTIAFVLAWLALVAIEWIDFDWSGKLLQPFTVIDTVKHAATTQAILDTGAPPRDPFFLRPAHASYYYFFYTLAALAQRVCFGLIDARAAVGGAVFWTGVGLYGLVRLAIARSGLATAPSRRMPTLVLAVLAASGLDILGVVRMGLLQGTWIADPVSWNEQIAGWLESLLWVPHHLVGLIASIFGMVALADLTERDGRPSFQTRRSLALAALCFASALGLSVWVVLGLVTTVAIWSVLLVVERRWRALGRLVLVGALAVLIASPQIVDLQAGRAATGASAIVPTIRAFTPVDGLLGAGGWRMLARLVALPVNYFAGFGVLVSGTILLWKTGGGFRRTEFGRLLVIAAFSGLALGAFLKSTLFNNDLGWRVVLFPLFAGTVWTIAALERLLSAPVALPAWRRVPAFLTVLFVLGWTTSLYALVNLRAYPWLSNEAEYRFIAEDPLTAHALRTAYEWADRTLPPGAVLQHDPAPPRTFAFALYGRHPTAVADSFGSLFGANPAAVDARIEALAPLFRSPLPSATVRAVAAASGVDDLVVTADDPIWSEPDAFVWHSRPIYASERVRIVPVAAAENPSSGPVGAAADTAAKTRPGAETSKKLGS